MLKIKMYDNNGHIELKIMGKRHTITKKSIKTWNKIEIEEV